MKIATVLKALNHPIRRDIMARLREGPINAGSLAAAYDVSKPTMSTHFASLKDADLIIGTKDGVSITYSLNATVAEDALSSLMGLLGSAETQTATTSAIEPGKNKSEPST